MIPGMGLTILGIAGVGLSLAGIARTFIEGMHAISALMMFIGMIILAAGILKDGLPTSNQAKATVIVIIGFLVTFGAFMIGMSTVPTLPLFAGTLLLILIPATVLAYAAQKQSAHFKALAIVFSSASVVGAITLVLFSLVTPQPIEAGVLEKPSAPIEGPAKEGVGEIPTVEEKGAQSTVAVDIVLGAADPNNPEFYAPREITVDTGTKVVWTNNDTQGHTVTSGNPSDADFGSLFDSSFPLMKTGETFEHTFNALGEYPYFCQVHPLMTAKVIVK